MKIVKSGNELIVQETPGCFWIFGLLFFFVGAVFIYGSLGGLNDWNATPLWQLVLTFLMGAIACSIGLRVFFHSPVTKVKVNRNSETLTHTKYGLMGKTETVYKFAEIKQFCLIEENTGEDDLIWSLGMELMNGETIKISVIPDNFEHDKRQFVFETNQFMYKQMPSYQNVLELEDESEPKIS